MGSDNFFNKHREERRKRKENVERQRSSNWLVVCEGAQTEPNYFRGAVSAINEGLEDKYKLKVKIVGKGMNTISLVKSVEDLLNDIDEYKTSTIPYGKIFVVFDKDSFSPESFDKAVSMCEKNGYIPLWSNQAIEYWFLLHFNYIEARMDRTLYESKINEYFKIAGLKYKYRKNDEEIYSKLSKYGSLGQARKNASRIHLNHDKDTPSNSESCTTVYKFFEEVDERLKELE
ncbi:MAG: RloB domain-containing protein [Lactobacillales bacterium]|nr:RloB domain-containing protein [Lactobacillales bacterium]